MHKFEFLSDKFRGKVLQTHLELIFKNFFFIQGPSYSWLPTCNFFLLSSLSFFSLLLYTIFFSLLTRRFILVNPHFLIFQNTPTLCYYFLSLKFLINSSEILCLLFKSFLKILIKNTNRLNFSFLKLFNFFLLLTPIS